MHYEDTYIGITLFPYCDPNLLNHYIDEQLRNLSIIEIIRFLRLIGNDQTLQKNILRCDGFIT